MKVNKYIVVMDVGRQGTIVEYIWAENAQKAVDLVRNDEEDIEILEVAKCVSNWK